MPNTPATADGPLRGPPLNRSVDNIMTVSKIIAQGGDDRTHWMGSGMREAVREASDRDALLSIVVPAKRHTQTTPLKYVLTQKQLERLEKGSTIRVFDVTVRLISPRAQELHSVPQVLLLVSARGEDISRIGKFQNVVARVVMPALESDLAAWRQATG